jgi:hypothetical protein
MLPVGLFQGPLKQKAAEDTLLEDAALSQPCSLLIDKLLGTVVSKDLSD